MDRCIGQQSLELAPGDTKAEPHELALQNRACLDDALIERDSHIIRGFVKQIDFVRWALIGPRGARQDPPIPLDTLSLELVYRHHRKVGARALEGPADSYAIATLEHVENFEAAVKVLGQPPSCAGRRRGGP